MTLPGSAVQHTRLHKCCADSAPYTAPCLTISHYTVSYRSEFQQSFHHSGPASGQALAPKGGICLPIQGDPPPEIQPPEDLKE